MKKEYFYASYSQSREETKEMTFEKSGEWNSITNMILGNNEKYNTILSRLQKDKSKYEKMKREREIERRQEMEALNFNLTCRKLKKGAN